MDEDGGDEVPMAAGPSGDGRTGHEPSAHRAEQRDDRSSAGEGADDDRDGRGFGRESGKTPDEFVRAARERKGLDLSVLSDFDDDAAGSLGGGSGGEGGLERRRIEGQTRGDAEDCEMPAATGSNHGEATDRAEVGLPAEGPDPAAGDHHSSEPEQTPDGRDVDRSCGAGRACGDGPAAAHQLHDSDDRHGADEPHEVHGPHEADQPRDTDQPQVTDEPAETDQLPNADEPHETNEDPASGEDRAWRRPRPGTPGPGSEKWAAGSVRQGPFEPGVAAVAEALVGLEQPGQLDDDTLQDRMVDLVRLRSRLDAVLATHASEWDHRSLWASDGSKAPGARLARDANCAKGTGRGIVGNGRAMARMPHTSAAQADGRISADHARRLREACTDERLEKFLEAEQRLIELAVQMAGDHAGFAKAVAYWEQITDDELYDPTDPNAEPPGRKRAREGRDFRMPETPDGFDLRGSLPKADGLIFRTQWQRIYDEMWEADWAEARAEHGDATTVAHLKRTVTQRRADALTEMAKRSSAWKPGDRVARPLVTVLVNYEDLAGPIRETFNGTVVPRRDVAQWLTEADFERIVFAPDGQPVDVTSKHRFFSGPMRRAVQVRDRICSHPTCDVDAERCQVDHIIEATDGGPTSLDNARLLCPRHNQQRPGRGKKPSPAGEDGGDGDDSDPDSDSDTGTGTGTDTDGSEDSNGIPS